jgi:hypothetical protein
LEEKREKKGREVARREKEKEKKGEVGRRKSVR